MTINCFCGQSVLCVYSEAAIIMKLFYSMYAVLLALASARIEGFSLSSKSLRSVSFGNSALSQSKSNENINKDLAPVTNKRPFPLNIMPSITIKNVALPLLLTALPILGFTQYAGAASSLAQSFDGISKSAADSGFVQSFLLIFISEIGDKTFFIAGLLAAKYGKLISFLGSIGALGIMTIISTVLGQIFHAVPSSLTQGVPFDDYIAVAAFSYFGLKTLYDASQISGFEDNAGTM